MKKRITSAIIALILCLTLLPATVLAAEPDTRHTIQPGASAINGWSADDGYDYIYLGNWNNKPVKWRVLSANGDGATFYRDETSAAKYGASALFLLSEYVQDSKQFRSSRSSNRWRGSTTENWCDTFNAGAFTSIESRALLTTSSSSAKKDAGGTFSDGTTNYTYTNANAISAGKKVFFLFASEATNANYGFGTPENRKADKDWWLMTAARDKVKYNKKDTAAVGAISKDTGMVTPTASTDSKGARPALNLNKDQVLFTTAADNSAHQDVLATPAPYDGREFKLTLKDANSFEDGTKIVGGRTTWNTAYTNATITIQHKALKDISGDYTNVTAALTDSNGDLLYYGAVNNDTAATSTTVTLPGGLANGTYTLSLYGEDWNDEYKSDYATGTPFAVEIIIHDGADGPDLTPREQDGLMSIDDLSGYDTQWGYNYLYFGKFGTAPILWRVLSASGNATGATDSLKQDDTTVSNDDAMFLLSEYLLGQGANGGLQFTTNDQETNVQYKGSKAQEWCKMATASDSPYKAFTAGELSAVLDTTKSDPEYAGKNHRNKVYAAAENILENDKVFFLSAEEAANAAYGFEEEGKLIAYYNSAPTEWWLRSAITDPDATSVGAVTYSNEYGWELCPKLATGYAPARSAFNLSKNDVLFVCTADGVKTGTVGTLTTIESNLSSKWKLTLLDESRNFSVTDTEVEKFAGGTLTLHYTGAQAGPNEYISAIFYDVDGKPAYYGRLKNMTDEANADGSVELTVPAGLGEDEYKLVLFNEQYNGARQTDYASRFCTVTLTVDNTAPVLSDFAVSRASDSTASVTFSASERGSYYNVVSDSETVPSIDTTGDGSVMSAGEQPLELNDIFAGKSYLHIVAEDVAGNVCGVQTIPILGFLPAPTNADWDDAVLGKASWDAVEHASGYRVQLYKDGTALGSPVRIDNPDTTSYAFTIPEPPAEDSDDSTTPTPTLPDNAITETGTYSFRVTALGDNTNYSNSVAAESARHLSSITVEENENGTVTASARYAVAGTEITLTGDPNSGYRFQEWNITPEVTVTDNKFVMPEEAVTVSAVFTRRPSSSTYPITVKDSKNGSAASSRNRAVAGEIVTITVMPDKGYTLETLTVTDKNGKEVKLTDKGGGRYTFTMPASGVTVTATFMDDNTMLNFFVDVKASDYFYDAVLWAAQNDITTGTDAVHFTPDGVCSRAQAVAFLWRAAGSHAPKSASMPFTDVPKGSYYETAVLWAVENGITKGTSDTTFSPDATCSRAQIVTFLWRSQKSPAVGHVNPFTDVSANAYYTDAVLWAVEENITKGSTATTFSPNADCTRAQIVTLLYRAYVK